MFGSTATTGGAGSTGFSFGANSGFSFGANTPGSAASTSAAPTSGFSLGGGATAPATSAPAGSSGFNFGSNTATTAPSTTGSSFGFGSTAAGPAAGATTGFGAQTSTAPASSSGFSFGGSNTPSTGGFGFGVSTNAAPASTSSFGFGANTNTTKPPLFGQKTATTTNTFGGFGSNTGSSFGSFGSTATKPSTGFGFGGASTTPGTSSFGFGQTPATGTTTPGFGFGTTPSTGLFGGAQLGAPGATVPVSTTPPPIIVGAEPGVAQLNTIKYAYQDLAQSRFKFLMYNTVDPAQRHLYTRPPYISERLWRQAELDNPDPVNCVPVLITGFQDLMKRVQVQQEYAEKYTNFTQDLNNQLKEMEKDSRSTEEKLEKCRHEHAILFHQLVKVMKDIEFLQNLNKPLQREETELTIALKKLQSLLDHPAQYKARLNELVSLQRIQENVPPSLPNQLCPEDLEKIYMFLEKQRQGLEHLTNILNEDLADIQLIKEACRR